jgi:hypothetical protein
MGCGSSTAIPVAERPTAAPRAQPGGGGARPGELPQDRSAAARGALVVAGGGSMILGKRSGDSPPTGSAGGGAGADPSSSNGHHHGSSSVVEKLASFGLSMRRTGSHQNIRGSTVSLASLQSGHAVDVRSLPELPPALFLAAIFNDVAFYKVRVPSGWGARARRADCGAL